MAEVEQFTAEQAEALFAESFNKVTGKDYPTTARTDDTPALEVKPVEVVPVVEGVTPPAAETAETKEPVEATPATEPEEETDDKKEEKAEDAYAWVEQLPDTIKGKVINEINARIAGEHYKKSNEGRVAAYQRQLRDAELALAKVKPADGSLPAPAGRTSQTPEEWAKLAKDDPEIATAVEARVKSEVDAAVSALTAEIQGLRKSGEVVQQHEHRQFVEQERLALQAAVPNYVDVMQSKEFQGWRDNEASPGLKNMALTSVHHLDAVTVLQAYADAMIRSGRATPREEARSTTTQTTKNSEQLAAGAAAKAEVDRIAAARDSRATQSTVVSAATPPLGGPGTNKAQFSAEDAEAEFQRVWAKLNPKKT